MNLAEMKNLAALARIDLSDKELESIAQEFEGILGYVAQIDKLEIGDTPNEQLQINVTRTDAVLNTTYPGSDLLAGAPDHQDGFYKVPKIL